MKRLVNPIKNVRLKSPDGRFFWVPENKVEEAYSKGLRHEDSAAKVPVTTISGREEEVEVADLPAAFSKGGSYKGFSQGIEDVEESIENINPEDHMTLTEKAGTTLTAFDPLFGGGKVVGGLVNRGLDSALGIEGNKTNETLREMQASQPYIQAGVNIASSIPASILTGGGMMGLAGKAGAAAGAGGKSAATLAKYGTLFGVGGAEGMAISGAMYAGEKALGNPEANAEKFIDNLGSSFLWGALPTVGVEAVGQGIKRLAHARQLSSSIKPIKGELPEVSFKSIDNGADNQTPFRNLQILDAKGEVIGNAKLAVKNPNASFNAAKEGISVEELVVNPTHQGRRVEQAAVGKLVSQFGNVYSPASGGKLTDEAMGAFESLGVTHTSEVGNQFVSAHRLPVAQLTTADQVIQKYGNVMKKHVDKIGGEDLVKSWNKFTRAESKEFRSKVLEYHNNPAKGTLDTVDNFQRIDNAAKEIRHASEILKTEMFKQFDVKQTHKLKNAIAGARDKTRSSLREISSIRGEYDSATQAAFKRMDKTLSDINSLEDPIAMLKNLRKQSQQLGGNIARLEKSNSTHPNSISKLKDLRRTIDDDIIRNKEVTGTVAENYSKLQTLQSRMISAEKKFNEAVKVKGVISEKKVGALIRSKDTASVAVRQNVEETYLVSVKKYLDEAEGIMDSVGIDLKPLKNREVFKTTFIGDMREMKEASNMIDSLVKGANVFGTGDAVLQGFLSNAGAAITSAVGLGWYPGAIMGQQAGTLGRRAFNHPLNMINRIENVGGMLSSKNPKKIVNKLLKPFSEAGARPSISSTELAKRVGVYFNTNTALSEDYPQMYDEIERKLSQVDKDSLAENLEILNEAAPEHSAALNKKALEVVEYIRQHKPPKPRRYKDTREDLKKMHALVHAAFNPTKSIEDFMDTGDTSGLKHIKALYPNKYMELESALLSAVDTEQDKSALLAKLDKFTEVKKIRSAGLLFQSYYANIKEEGAEQPNKKLPASAKNSYGEGLTTETERLQL